MTNQDLGAHPRVDQWSNGTDSAAELTADDGRCGARRSRASASRRSSEARRWRCSRRCSSRSICTIAIRWRRRHQHSAGRTYNYTTAWRRPGFRALGAGRAAAGVTRRRAGDAHAGRAARSRRRAQDRAAAARRLRAPTASCFRATPGRCSTPSRPPWSPLTTRSALLTPSGPRGSSSSTPRPVAAGARRCHRPAHRARSRCCGRDAYEEQLKLAVQRVVMERLMALARTRACRRCAR